MALTYGMLVLERADLLLSHAAFRLLRDNFEIIFWLNCVRLCRFVLLRFTGEDLSRYLFIGNHFNFLVWFSIEDLQNGLIGLCNLLCKMATIRVLKDISRHARFAHDALYNVVGTVTCGLPLGRLLKDALLLVETVIARLNYVKLQLEPISLLLLVNLHLLLISTDPSTSSVGLLGLFVVNGGLRKVTGGTRHAALYKILDIGLEHVAGLPLNVWVVKGVEVEVDEFLEF